ncbi:MAG TPA: cell envelope integrity protein TolA [Woeseiaceae bacterium]|nr:cell envelope integrity protein TolA [Woeseiaceae bacterium]
MSRNSLNIGPVGLSVLLHVVIFASMIVAVDYARPTPFTPLVVQATLVPEAPERAAPPPRVEPEPEPVIEEPEPDNSEELRRQAEEEKRRLDALLEQKRLDELKRQEEAERKRKEREEAERKKAEEEEKERQRREAERKRQEDIERQRQENERLRREMEEEERQAEIDAEARRLAAENSPEMAVYQNMIAQKIQRSWAMPASATEDTVCVVRVSQTRTGDVIDANIVSCNGDEALRRSVLAAVNKASPLPEPPNPDLFRAELRITLRPDL